MLYIILSAICFVTLAHGAASSSVVHIGRNYSSSGKVESPLQARDQRFSQSENTLSFIYYPSGREKPIVGHCEMEVNGTMWNLGCCEDYGSRPLAKAITAATTYGLPFLRFMLEADSDQVHDINPYLCKSECSPICTRAALYPLSKVGAISVPFPINVSPLATALYLKVGATFGTNNIKHIEYYGNPSFSKNLATALLGTIGEACVFSIASYSIFKALMALYIAGLSHLCTNLPL